MFQAQYKNENAIVTFTRYYNQSICYITITYIDQPRIDSQRVLPEEFDQELKRCEANAIFLHGGEYNV